MGWVKVMQCVPLVRNQLSGMCQCISEYAPAYTTYKSTSPNSLTAPAASIAQSPPLNTATRSGTEGTSPAFTCFKKVRASTTPSACPRDRSRQRPTASSTAS